MSKVEYLQDIHGRPIKVKTKGNGDVLYYDHNGRRSNDVEPRSLRLGDNKQCKREYEISKFAYDAALPILPEGLEYKYDQYPETNTPMFNIRVADTASGVELVKTTERVLPTTKEEFVKVVSEMVDDLVIPQYNPLDFIRGQ